MQEGIVVLARKTHFPPKFLDLLHVRIAIVLNKRILRKLLIRFFTYYTFYTYFFLASIMIEASFVLIIVSNPFFNL